MASPAPASPPAQSSPQPGLKRSLTLWGLILYGIIVIQPVAPMSGYGMVSTAARGHVVTAILLAMVAMACTAFSYGRMARVYPSAGSAYTYVSREVHALPGYITGWSMAMDYILNPLICTILCSKLMLNYLTALGSEFWVKALPYEFWICVFAGLFVSLNLVGVKTNAKINAALAAFMGAVILWVLWAAMRYVLGLEVIPAHFFTAPVYDPNTFEVKAILSGTGLAVLTYIGFDGISTLSEEVENPQRNVLLATVLTCLVIGGLAALQVYAAQLVAWPQTSWAPDVVESAFVLVSRKMGGPVLFAVVNATLLVATIGSGMASLLGAARLLYGMGRENALPRRFFGFVNRTGVPRNNVLLVGAIALLGAALSPDAKHLGSPELMSFQRGAELLNFGALIAFMGVNVAAFVHYVVRGKQRTLSMIVPPIVGVALCFYLWINLNEKALKLGAAWMVVGLLYGAWVRWRSGKLSLGDMTEG
jgi:putrescine importer